jgi:cyclophilin family peptidyl-prolyl cis-trans isomerase
MRSKGILYTVIGFIAVGLLISSYIVLIYAYFGKHETTPQTNPSASPAPEVTIAPSGVPASPMPATAVEPDLTVDANGLSKSTVVITTTYGIIKFKFYPKDAPNTVNRVAELIKQGFYNGLIFHRVVPGFVIQGGDPQGTGAGGSGVKLKAEFNGRRHNEGTVAMARAADPDSADSQFYIALAPQPHLDNSYTIFGQVIEGMDVVRKIQMGDKMTSVTIQN